LLFDFLEFCRERWLRERGLCRLKSIPIATFFNGNPAAGRNLLLTFVFGRKVS
jgi:hypothetical protein